MKKKKQKHFFVEDDIIAQNDIRESNKKNKISKQNIIFIIIGILSFLDIAGYLIFEQTLNITAIVFIVLSIIGYGGAKK